MVRGACLALNTKQTAPVAAPAVKEDVRKTEHNKFTVIVNKFGVFFMILLLFVAGTMISDKFLSVQNMLNILDAVALLGIVATGVGFVIYCGQCGDMSVPMVMAISGIISIEFVRFGLLPALIAGVLTGCVIGLINGWVIGKLRVNAIIWTLAMNFLLDGSIRWFYKGTQIYPDVAGVDIYEKGFFLPMIYKLWPGVVNVDMVMQAEKFNALARTYFFGKIPLMLVVMIIVMIIGYIILAKTTFGNQLKIVGSNYQVGKMTGIKSTRTIITAFMLSSVCASIAGILVTSVNKVGAYYVGAGYDFRAVTAIILGGVSLAGGRGSIIGVFGGVFTLGLISNILTLLGVGTFEQQMITGFIFILVVAVNANSLRKLGRDDA